MTGLGRCPADDAADEGAARRSRTALSRSAAAAARGAGANGSNVMRRLHGGWVKKKSMRPEGGPPEEDAGRAGVPEGGRMPARSDTPPADCDLDVESRTRRSTSPGSGAAHRARARSVARQAGELPLSHPRSSGRRGRFHGTRRTGRARVAGRRPTSPGPPSRQARNVSGSSADAHREQRPGLRPRANASGCCRRLQPPASWRHADPPRDQPHGPRWPGALVGAVEVDEMDDFTMRDEALGDHLGPVAGSPAPPHTRPVHDARAAAQGRSRE